MKIYKRAKIIFAAFMVTCIMFFTNDCQLIDVQKTAIIVALGIDSAGGELEITAQIAIPQADDSRTSNSDAILSARGKTLFEALDDIGVTTGWYPKLAFCNLIVFSQELINKEYMPVIDYILSSDRFVNSAIIAACEGKAKEVLSSPTPLDYISSFTLQKILVRDIDRANTVLVTDVREFARDARSQSGFSYMPLIKKKQTDDKPKGSSNESNAQNSSEKGNEKQSAKALVLNQICPYKSIIGTSGVQGGDAAGKGGQDDGSDSQNGKTVFDARSALLFSHGKYRCTVTPEQTLCFNALNERVTEAFFSVSYDKKGEQINSIVSVNGNEKSINLTFDGGVPKYTARLKLYCKNEEISVSEDSEKLAYYDKASEECLAALSKKVEKELSDMFELSRKNDCDAFELKNLTYRKRPEKYQSFKDNILSLVSVEFKVECVNES